MDILDTRQRKKEVYHFIIIVPHRDSLKPLEEYQARLFAAGFPGAFSFPMAAPLASVSRPFNREELKELGRNIRELTNKAEGKIYSSGSVLTQFTTEEERRRPLAEAQRRKDRKDISFFGPTLSLTIEERLFSISARAKIVDILSPAILCAALLAPEESPPSEEGPAISFRAASIANLAIRPLESGASSYSFKWKMGPFIWLPKYKGG